MIEDKIEYTKLNVRWKIYELFRHLLFLNFSNFFEWTVADNGKSTNLIWVTRHLLRMLSHHFKTIVHLVFFFNFYIFNFARQLFITGISKACRLTGFPFECAHHYRVSNPDPNVHIIIHRLYDDFQHWNILYLHHNKVSVLPHDCQQTTKNCQTQSSLKRVENHVEELINYYDANTTFDSCWKTCSK